MIRPKIYLDYNPVSQDRTPLTGNVVNESALDSAKAEGYIVTCGRKCLAMKGITANKSARTHSTFTANQK